MKKVSPMIWTIFKPCFTLILGSIMNVSKYLRILFKNLLIVMVAMIAIEAYKTRDMLSDPKPALEKYKRVALLDRGFIDLSAKSDKPKILYFFAPWCPVCKQISSILKL